MTRYAQLVRTTLAVLVLLAACTRQTAVVWPAELASHAPELVEHGEATVYGTDSAKLRVSADEVIDVSLADGDTQRPARLTVRELVSGCVADVGAPGCLARQATVERPITLRRPYRFSGTRLATGLTFAVIGGAVGTCVVACQGGAELRKDLAYGGIGVIGGVGLLVLLMMLGGHD